MAKKESGGGTSLRALWRWGLRCGFRWADRLGPLAASIRQGPARGLRFRAPASRLFGAVRGRYEPAVLAALAAAGRPGGCAIDLGAHLGLTSLVLARAVGPDGRVFSFEPQSTLQDPLRRNLADNQLTWAQVVPFAVADRSGEAFLLREANDSMARLVSEGGSGAGIKAGETVPLMRLDHWWTTFVESRGLAGPGARLDVVKLDLEGGELAALRGGEDLLKRYRPALVLELHRASWLADDRAELVDWLRVRGYRVGALADLAQGGVDVSGRDEARLDRRLETWSQGEPRGMEILHLLAVGSESGG